ncbi:MAG: serine hydrolase, partial [Alphaproteobacteria bacterium]|nr:serine hydrolase [Alphaproteobacteria bacterium]
MLKIFVIFFSILAVSQAKDRSASIVVDGQTGKVLHAENETALRYPASLTKKMTIYLAFEALRKGRITMNTQFRVSKRAAMQLPSKIWLKPGEMITVRKLLESLIVKSANDSAVVMAEGLEGSVEKFATAMTKKAHALGMNHSVFKNPSGLNDQLKNDPRQYTTAKDMAILAMALHRDFPQHAHLFGLTQFSYRGKVFH